jgi:uncharacterized membrane protein
MTPDQQDIGGNQPPSRLELVNERLDRGLAYARFGIRELAYRVELLGIILVRLGLLVLLGVATAAILAGVGVLVGKLATDGPQLAESFAQSFMAASLASKAWMVAVGGILLLITGGVLLLAGVDRRSKR